MAETDRFEAFAGIIFQLNKEIQRLKKTEMERFGLHGTDALLLVCLSKHSQGIAAADIAHSIGVDRALVSRSINALQNTGYVEVSTVQGSTSYRNPVLLTPKGYKLWGEVNRIINRLVGQAAKDLAADEVTVMYRALGKVLENLKEL